MGALHGSLPQAVTHTGKASFAAGNDDCRQAVISYCVLMVSCTHQLQNHLCATAIAAVRP